jgi:hypothetical protein
MTATTIRPIAMHYNAQQLEKIRPILEAEGFRIQHLQGLEYLCNYRSAIPTGITDLSKGAAQNHRRTVFDTWDEDTFLHYCGINLKTSTTCTVSIQDVLRIHEVACFAWKQKIATKYLPKVTSDLTIELNQKEVTEMFDAANSEQQKVLESIFGAQSKPVDISQLKTGSIVKIKYTGQHISGFDRIDTSKPLTVVLRSNFRMYPDGTFGEACRMCLTMYQEGKYCVFAGEDKNIDYITEVISY